MSSSPGGRLASELVGRTFLHPLYDYLLIGGLLSLAVLPLVFAGDYSQGWFSAAFPLVLLAANSSHFAASTVRLYTKPGSFESLPFLTQGLPLVCIAVLTLCLLLPEVAGRHLQALYLTWSPFHYAAQTFGLASMYCMRSGRQLLAGERSALRWVCLLPFFYAFLSSVDAGLWWFVPRSAVAGLPGVLELLASVRWVLRVASFAAPLLLFAWLWRRGRKPMPLISLLLLIVNGSWWVLFTYLEAFVMATVFHGIQYLAIVVLFHAKERQSLPTNRHGTLRHALNFYAMSLALAYALFHLWPRAWQLLGFGVTESVLLVIAIINVHHFIVDAFIWRLRQGDTRQVVVSPG